MRFWLMAGSSALGMLLGWPAWNDQVQAQTATPTPGPRPIASAATPPARPAVAQPAGGPQRVAYQPPTPPLPATSAPDPSAPAAAPAPAPPTPGPDHVGTEPLRSNTDLSLPAAEREGLGGEPTEATAEEEAEASKAPEKDPTKLLMNLLGMEESPVKVYGWLQNSYTGNTNGKPPSGLNFGVNPNYLANSWMGNQYYLIVENPLEQGEKVNFGFRVDSLFGNDWQFNHTHGLFDTVAKLNHFNGFDLPQIYGEVHLPPVLSKGGTDIKGGHFYTILGYEVVPATGRPLLSVPYMFNYGQPFTHVGAMATTHVTDRVNWYNGVVNGWDRWINQNYKWGYLGGFSWTSKDGKANLAVSYTFGPNQYPRFLPTNTVVWPTGYSPIGFMAGRANPLYGGSWRTMFTEVFTYKWSDTFFQIMETDQGNDPNIPGWGPGGTPAQAAWYSFGNWFLWQFWKKDDRDLVTAVWRSEWFRDVNGIRTGTGKTDNFYEMTVGLIIKPTPYLWIRPEARYDWAQWNKPYNDGTRGSQFTIAVDAILLY